MRNYIKLISFKIDNYNGEKIYDIKIDKLKDSPNGENFKMLEDTRLHFEIQTDYLIYISLAKSNPSYKIVLTENKHGEYYIPSDWPNILTSKMKSLKSEIKKFISNNYNSLCSNMGENRLNHSLKYFDFFNKRVKLDLYMDFLQFKNWIIDDPNFNNKELKELKLKSIEILKNLPNGPFDLLLKSYGL